MSIVLVATHDTAMIRTGDFVKLDSRKVLWPVIKCNGVPSLRDGVLVAHVNSAGFNGYYGIIVAVIKNAEHEYTYYVLLHDGRRGWVTNECLTKLANP